MKAILNQLTPDVFGSPVTWNAEVAYINDDGSYLDHSNFAIDLTSKPRSNAGIHAAVVAGILADALTKSYSITAQDILSAFGGAEPDGFLNGVSEAGVMPYIATGSVAGGLGVVRLYLTDNGASNGNAVFSEVLADSIQPMVFGGNANVFSFGTPTVSGDRKYIDLPVYRQNFTGIVLLSTNILGSVALAAAPNATVVKAVVLGKQ